MQLGGAERQLLSVPAFGATLAGLVNLVVLLECMQLVDRCKLKDCRSQPTVLRVGWPAC